eukprot:TRINITY_DN10776_c0_g1_i1.p1 TRINITY_DN10776_c0_g1~~TRINITY_DN10776_c0_g1_i1.p1  ORF type:complete len:208 (+),score=31.62 TRINITY_DN10776_c0_g1_i1:59-625(+)
MVYKYYYLCSLPENKSEFKSSNTYYTDLTAKARLNLTKFSLETLSKILRLMKNDLSVSVYSLSSNERIPTDLLAHVIITEQVSYYLPTKCKIYWDFERGTPSPKPIKLGFTVSSHLTDPSGWGSDGHDYCVEIDKFGLAFWDANIQDWRKNETILGSPRGLWMSLCMMMTHQAYGNPVLQREKLQFEK